LKDLLNIKRLEGQINID